MFDIDPTLPDKNQNDNKNNFTSDGTSNNDHINKKKIMLKKNSVGHLPKELLKFANNDSYSLLIKGEPGTGKTTFALTLMDNLIHNSNYFYISTRLSIKQLTYFYPWISKFTLKNESQSEYKFEDARLDEPESLFERITNQLMDVKSPIIIIDTWDAIASFMDRESRLNNERVLQIWRERAGAKLIFLSESCDITLLDSIVDGVIVLEHEFKNSNYYRKMIFSKLRGIPINCSRYNFSLFDGFFFVFDSINDLNLFENPKIGKFNKNKIYNKNHKYLLNKPDFFIELFNNNKLVTMDFDSNLNNSLILSILLKPLYYWIVSGNAILVNNFQWNLYTMLKKIISFFIDSQLIENNLLNKELDYLKFFAVYDDIYDIQNKPSDNKKDVFKNFETYTNQILSEIFKNKNPDHCYNNILNILDGNSVSNLISNFKFVEFIKTSPINNLIIIKNDTSTINSNVLCSESNYYKIILKDNNILIKCINPPTSVFGAINEYNNYFVDWCPLY
jgi:KaiC/GvpD/RAD55 family RecA-like ATPase